MRKRIAVLLAQMEENTQKRFMHAFMEEAYANDYDICVFSMYQKYQETDLRNAGDSNIFTLIQYDLFDGIVIMIDTIQTPDFAPVLLKRVKENFSGPVIVVDQETDLFDYILMDHYSPIVELTNHLIDVHGYKKIAFLGGKEGHPHSVQRLDGFLVAMHSHGLSIPEKWIYHGNYWYQGGHEFSEILLADKNNLPEAVVCANDYMAIGLASRLEDAGLRIPEDIAICGYDSCMEGKTAPLPLTSADIPAPQCGKLAFYKLHKEITGTEIPNLDLEPVIIIGGSCGCTDFEPIYTKVNREHWKTDNSVVSYYSDFNHITEDMLCQTQYEEFFKTLALYSHQIRPFHSFWMCVNDNFLDAAAFIGENARRVGYSDTMNMVIKLGETLPDKDPDCVQLNRSFDRKILLPEMYEERSYPTTYVFTPMFFEDRCFGYVVFNQGPSLDMYQQTYRMWMRNVNQGIESFYRQKALFTLIEQIKADQVRDRQTGLYNYRGFHETLTALCKENLGQRKTLAILAFDIEGLKEINEKYGRPSGDCAIQALALFLSHCVRHGEVCGRLSNDEFLFGIISDDCDLRTDEIISKIDMGIPYKNAFLEDHTVRAHSEMMETSLGEMPDLDFLINQTVNAMNYNKKRKLIEKNTFADFTEEEICKCHEVEKILDQSLLTYSFQPIVNAHDGKIYGYEALMRYHGETALTPLEILRFASALERLYDVERFTFQGVFNHIDANANHFTGKKIFINSLPAHQLHGEDEQALFKRFEEHAGQIVVEYTEQSEFTDEALSKCKEDYARLGVEIALDDYGSGYSNANNLLRYTPRYVKVDHMLISDISNNAQKRHFVKSIIDYAGKNDILVLAEGVETLEELKTVIELGVDLIQGFYTGRPAAEPPAQIHEDVAAQIRRSYRNRNQMKL